MRKAESVRRIAISLSEVREIRRRGNLFCARYANKMQCNALIKSKMVGMLFTSTVLKAVNYFLLAA